MREDRMIKKFLKQSLEEEGAAALEDFSKAASAGEVPEVSAQTADACRRMNRLHTQKKNDRSFRWNRAAAIALVLLMLLAATGTVAAAVQLNAIYHRFTDHLSVDAPVEDHGCREGLSAYSAEPMTFTREDVESFLAERGEIADTWTASEEHEVAFTNLGSRIHGDRTGFTYLTKDYLEWFDRYPIYYGQAGVDAASNEAARLYARFTEPARLSFASAPEAEQAVRTLLADLGMDHLCLIRTLTVTAERMNEVDEDLRENRISAKHNCTPQEVPWRQEQECYVFEFASTVDGIPVTVHHWNRSAENMDGSILVWYGSSGILNLTVNGAWESLERLEAPKTMISAEEAVNTVREAFLFPTTIDREITCVELVYLFEQKNGSWRLFPAWEVTLHQFPSEIVPRDYWAYIRIDAVTGEKVEDKS